MCDECCATNPTCIRGSGPFNYMNFARDAGWTNTLIDNDIYMDECPYEHLSPFMQIEGHCKELCWRDFAHLDPLGLGRDLGAALIKSMYLRKELSCQPASTKACTCQPACTLDAKLRALWSEFNLDRKKHGKSKASGYFSAAGVGMDNM